MADYHYPTAFNTFGDEEKAAALRVLETGQLTIGREVRAFEEEFAEFHDKKHCVMCNSGSSANLLMVAALCAKADDPLRPGDKVLVPALAWSTTYAPLVQHGLDLQLHDVDASWNATPLEPPPWRMMPDALKGVRLIVGASILGIPTHMQAWKAVARTINAYLIEDNCESLGGRDPFDRLCGTFGVMSSSSFFFSHQVNGIEGGAVLTDDDELADLCRMLRAHGWTRDVKPRTTFEDEYDFRLMGYNLRPLEINAAVARVQLKKLPEALSYRYENATRFFKALESPMPQPLAAGTARGFPSYFGIHFMVPPQTRPFVVGALRAAGIDCRLPAGGSFRKHAYGLRWANQATPRADLVHDCGLFIGNAPFDLGEKVDQAAEIVNKVVHERETEGEDRPGATSTTCDPA